MATPPARRDTAPIPTSDALAEPRSGWLLKLLFLLVGLALAGAVALAGWSVATTVVVLLEPTDAAGDASLDQFTAPGQGDVVVDDPEAAPNVWDYHGPLNILLLGLDETDCADPVETTALRTDTIILVRVDPQTRRAAMLSIPRDLYVFIPGYGARKINTAHVLGDDPDDPGAGPRLLESVLYDNLQLAAQRYVRIDFRSFEKLIDEGLGGLDIDLPPSIEDPTVSLVDTEYPDGRCGTMTIRFEPGRQHLTGAQALQYARSRYSSSDFDRSRRQMEVLLAIKDEASSPVILTRLPKLIPALQRTVDTDLSATEIFSLARVATGVRREDVISLRMDESIVYNDMLVIDGVPQAVLRVNQAAFDDLRGRFLGLIAPTPTPTATSEAAAAPYATVTP